MSKITPFAILLLLGALGCKKPTVESLAGTWVMAAEPRWLPHQTQKTSGEIVLNADGTFSAKELPALFWRPDQPPPEPTSGTGTWRLLNRGQGEQIQLSFQTLRGGRMGPVWPGMPEPTLPIGTDIHIRRAWLVGRRFILYYMADSESHIIEFQKKPN